MVDGADTATRRLLAALRAQSLALGLVAVALLLSGGAMLLQRTAPTGPAFAESVLLDSIPDPWTGPDHDQYAGFDQFTAGELSGIHWRADLGHLNYVPADEPSTEPKVVSVNPIDNNTWGAAAYSVRAQRCYVIVSVVDKSTRTPAEIWYGRLASGAACTGEKATRANANSNEALPE